MNPKTPTVNLWALTKSIMFSMTLIVSPAWSQSQPLQAVVVGDSLSAGALSNSSGLKMMGVKDKRDPLWKLIIKELFVHEEFSWANGDNMRSVKKLLAKDGIYVKFDNLSEIGATYLDVLSKQVPAAYNKAKIYDFALVFAGANDLCVLNDLGEVQENMVEAVAALSHISKKVYILPLPRIDMLNAVAKGKRTKWLLPVETVWKLHGICPQLTINGGKNQNYNSNWVSEFNFIVETLAMVSAPEVESISKLHGIMFQPKHISNQDAFHASLAGQELIAKTVYDYIRQDFFSPVSE